MFELITCDQDGLFGETKRAVMQLSVTKCFFLTPLSYKYLIFFVFCLDVKQKQCLFTQVQIRLFGFILYIFGISATVYNPK